MVLPNTEIGAPKVSIETLAGRGAAKRIAKAERRKWKHMFAVQLAALRDSSQQQVNAEDRKKAVLMLAKHTAKERGLIWKILTKNQRQALIAEVRQTK